MWQKKLGDSVFSCPRSSTSCTAKRRLLGPYNYLGTESKADKHLGETAQLLCWKKNSCHDFCLIESAYTHAQKTHRAAETGHECLRIQLQKSNARFLKGKKKKKKVLCSFASVPPPLFKENVLRRLAPLLPIPLHNLKQTRGIVPKVPLLVTECVFFKRPFDTSSPCACHGICK